MQKITGMILLILVLTATLAMGRGKKKIDVQPLMRGADAGTKLTHLMPDLSGFTEVAKGLSCVALYDSNNIYFAVTASRPEYAHSLHDIGLRMKVKVEKGKDFVLRFASVAGNPRHRRPVPAISGIEPLLPRTISERLHSYAPLGEYSVTYLPEDRRFGSQLTVTDFDALFQDSSATLIVRIPLTSPVYPKGVLPFTKKGKLELDVEVGDDSPLSRFMRGGGGFPPVTQRGGQPPPMGLNDDSQRYGFEKFGIELMLRDWSRLATSLDVAGLFHLTDYMSLLDRWSASSHFSRGRGYRGGGGRGSGGMVPISAQALFVSSDIVETGIAYIASYLQLSAEEQAQILLDFAEQWKMNSSFPVLLTLRTSLHESYLDLSRWTIFLQDDKRNQYEALATIELPNPALKVPAAGRGGEQRLRRPSFLSQMKRLVMQFPLLDRDGGPLWQKRGRKLKLILISNENAEQRLELEWRVPESARK